MLRGYVWGVETAQLQNSIRYNSIHQLNISEYATCPCSATESNFNYINDCEGFYCMKRYIDIK